MNNEVFKYYVDELNLLTNFVKIAALDFNEALNQDDSNLIWYDLQNIVTYASDISKILWGSKGSENRNRQKFREILGADDGWEITYKNKTLRNKLEHIDENLVKFSKQPHSLIYNRNIVSNYNAGVRVNNVAYNPNKESTLRSYNSELGEYVIFGQAFNIKKACEECRTLRLKTDDIVKSGVTYENLVGQD
ncbi:hypothetical protein [Lactiplantibacillus plantarum]|uniref:hypothetical protein n=1 Tax=Lactiplantibacillus plantarum TaxID=1590 RepID=UPI0015DE6AE1|nr:hypothetical protein [Lactiplantibacillus plantarum]QLL37782.1 hypothetical protein FEM49_00698 [Lactiplantibacillus plantarum]